MANAELFEFLDQCRLGVARRGLGELALGGDALGLHDIPDVHGRKHGLLVIGRLVVGSLHVELEEAVEEHLGRLDIELLLALVRVDLDGGVEDACVSHLRGHGALPDKVVKLLLLGGAFDGGILYEGRAYGLVRFLRALGVCAELARMRVFLSEIVKDELLGRAEGER